MFLIKEMIASEVKELCGSFNGEGDCFAAKGLCRGHVAAAVAIPA